MSQGKLPMLLCRTYATKISLLCCLLLTACGFHPLYQSPYEFSNVSYPIKIETIADRQGQILRNHLLDILTPEGPPAKPQYTLVTKIKNGVVDTGLRRDETAVRKKVVTSATIQLKDCKNRVVYSHTVSATNSYSILSENYYADAVAIDYARDQALREIAEKIKMLISTYFDTECENRKDNLKTTEVPTMDETWGVDFLNKKVFE